MNDGLSEPTWDFSSSFLSPPKIASLDLILNHCLRKVINGGDWVDEEE